MATRLASAFVEVFAKNAAFKQSMKESSNVAASSLSRTAKIAEDTIKRLQKTQEATKRRILTLGGGPGRIGRDAQRDLNKLKREQASIEKQILRLRMLSARSADQGENRLQSRQEATRRRLLAFRASVARLGLAAVGVVASFAVKMAKAAAKIGVSVAKVLGEFTVSAVKMAAKARGLEGELSAPFTKLQGIFDDIKLEIGDALLPAVQDLSKAFDSLIESEFFKQGVQKLKDMTTQAIILAQASAKEPEAAKDVGALALQSSVLANKGAIGSGLLALSEQKETGDRSLRNLLDPRNLFKRSVTGKRIGAAVSGFGLLKRGVTGKGLPSQEEFKETIDEGQGFLQGMMANAMPPIITAGNEIRRRINELPEKLGDPKILPDIKRARKKLRDIPEVKFESGRFGFGELGKSIQSFLLKQPEMEEERQRQLQERNNRQNDQMIEKLGFIGNEMEKVQIGFSFLGQF